MSSVDCNVTDQSNGLGVMGMEAISLSEMVIRVAKPAPAWAAKTIISISLPTSLLEFRSSSSSIILILSHSSNTARQGESPSDGTIRLAVTVMIRNVHARRRRIIVLVAELGAVIE